MIKAKIMLWSFFSIALMVTLALADQKPPWKGTISREGDVIVVNNPKKPQYGPGSFSLKENLSIGGRDTADHVLADITWVSVGRDGTIFVTDAKEKNLKAFGQDGKFLRTIGRAGEGPGEFRLLSYVHCTSRNEILVVNGMRLSIFKPNGDHVRDIAASTLSLIDAYPDSRGNFFATLIVRDESNPRYELRKLDNGLKDLFVLDSSPLSNSARDGYDPFFPVFRWSALSRDRAVSGYAVKYELRIHDAKGRLVRKVEMDPDRISVSLKDIEERTAGSPP